MHILTFIRHQIRKLRDWQAERDAIRQLRDMDDHFLRDIGIERQDIETVVHGLTDQRHTAKNHQRWLHRQAETQLHMALAE